jgi:co-chaperonin GroES (HSP10)
MTTTMDHSLDDWQNDEDVSIPDDLPEPFLWRLLVMPVRPKTMSKGGIMLAQSAQEAQQYLTFVGKILKVGDLAYKSDKMAGQTWFPQVGEWVGFGKHAGFPIEYKGLRLVLLNDDHIMFGTKNPDGFKVHV